MFELYFILTSYAFFNTRMKNMCLNFNYVNNIVLNLLVMKLKLVRYKYLYFNLVIRLIINKSAFQAAHSLNN